MKKILTKFTDSPEDLKNGTLERFPIHVMLENIRSLYNVGAVFRTADAARVEKLHLCGITGRPPRKEIAKTALGAQDTVPWESFDDAVQAIDILKQRDVRIVAVEHTTASTSLWKTSITYPVCFVFGYEIDGISQTALNCCDEALEIPMFGYKGSLNVAISCGIVVYEALRRLKSKG